MQNRVPFLLLTCFGLSVALSNAQIIVANGRLENRVASASRPTPIRAAQFKSATLQKYADLPLSFERHGDSEFLARGQGYALDIRGARATISLPVSGVSSTVGMEFVHGRQVAAMPEKELPGKVNYILGNDPRRWRLGLPTYQQVTYHDLYPGIDVMYYGNQKQLEFDLVLKPGADVRSARMRFNGPGKPQTDPSGSLMLGELKLIAPTVIQGKKTIAARYKMLANGDVAFEVGAYDRRQPLIIDPTLVYSTQMGGGNQFNRGNAIALDASGNAYIAGITDADDFPVVSAAFAGYDANGDGFISKVNSAGTALMYSTYIGGSSNDQFLGIAVDSTGAAWAVGQTSSPDFPLLSPYQNTFGGNYDAVVVKLSPNGTLAYSSFLGGPSYEFASSVAVDPFGNAYVAGLANAGFPTTAGVFEPVNQGGADAFAVKFSSSGSLVWSTFVGGNNVDYANGIAADSFGNTYIAGLTYSLTFPNAPAGGAQTTNHGVVDAFVAKLNFNASSLLYFTFLGGSGYDQANAIAVDSTSGIAVIAGQTASADLSTSPGAVQSANAGGYDGFVAKLNAAGSAFLYTTYLGGNRNDFIQGLAVDPSGNAYVVGTTDSNTFPVTSAIQTSMQGNSTSLFHSSNTGANWTPFDANIPGSVYDISPDPAVAGTIVVSTENGVYRTTNGGGTWTQQSSAGYLGLGRSPANPAVIYGFNCNAYQSTDNGVTWNFKGTTSPNCVNRIVADPTNASTAYVYGSFGVLKTTNNGASWSPAITGLPANQNVGKMVAASDGSLYVALRNAIAGQASLGVYKSSNQGGSWTSANNGLYSNFPFGDLAAGPSNAVYITDFFNLYESTNGGAAWILNGSLPVAFVGCIANALGISGVNPAVVYWAPCYFGWGVAPLAASSNAGASWSPASGLGAATINQIVGDPLNAAGAYALSYLSSVPFVAKIDAAGKNLLYSTYLGDSGNGQAIATNGTGDAFATGSTFSKAFPITPSALQGNNPSANPPTEVFVTRISDSTASCSFSVSPQPYLLGPYESAVLYSVVGPSGCPWTASSNQGWASILTGAAGSGTGVVYVLLNVNTTGATRAATLTIAGEAVTLNQLPTSCNASFSTGSITVPPGGGTVVLNVLAGSTCRWNVLNNDPNAIIVVSGASGTGNGTVTLNVAANLGPNTRTFIFGIQQGGSETVSQAGTTAPAVVATITSSPSGASITVTGTGCIPGTFTTPASLTWNANTNCTVYFTTPQTIAGSPYTFYSATVNGGPSTTTNPLTVNSGTTPPTIDATFLAPCTYSLSSPGQSFTAAGGLGSFTVNTAPTCGWSLGFSAGWITAVSPFASPGGGSPQGTGTRAITFAVASNSGGARAGSVSVGGQTYNVTQAAFSCSYIIGPTSASPGDTGGNVSVSVSASSGCPWTAVSNVSWVTVHSGASGSGGGVVVLTIAPNTGGTRSGTATIAGKTFSVTQGAGACGALDVTSQVSVSGTGLTPIPFSTYEYSQSITVSSSSDIFGPVYLVLIGEPTHYGYPNDSGLFGGGSTTSCFSSPGDYLILVSGTDLVPGHPVGIPLVWFTQSPGGLIQYSTKVLSGTPSH